MLRIEQRSSFLSKCAKMGLVRFFLFVFIRYHTLVVPFFSPKCVLVCASNLDISLDKGDNGERNAQHDNQS